eukprot:TRINITY_DN21211_c0_g1_i1.p1 TRINITY_DN21211_c0_g1~~TRINITY_DN21211_c0_g1_i1.p1  ORF type:complete len:228 (-),score=49.32 TRINITY_DN21211_c0_g1_i1:191-778(-)
MAVGDAAKTFAFTQDDIGLEDGRFKCSFCNQVIEDGQDMFMCRDSSYCTATCRRRGRRAEQDQRLMEGRRCGSVVSTIDSAPSESTASSMAASGQDGGQARNQGGMIRWLVGAAVQRFASMVEGTELLQRVPSNGDHMPSGLQLVGRGVSGGATGGPGDCAEGLISFGLEEDEEDASLRDQAHIPDFVRLIEGGH